MLPEISCRPEALVQNFASRHGRPLLSHLSSYSYNLSLSVMASITAARSALRKTARAQAVFRPTRLWPSHTLSKAFSSTATRSASLTQGLTFATSSTAHGQALTTSRHGPPLSEHIY